MKRKGYRKIKGKELRKVLASCPEIRQVLENYLEKSTPAQLRAELRKRERPMPFTTTIITVGHPDALKVSIVKVKSGEIALAKSLFPLVLLTKDEQIQWLKDNQKVARKKRRGK